MIRQFPTYENPVMVYTANNEYAVIPAEDLPLALAAGWFVKPQSESAYEPFAGDLDFQPVEEPSPSLDKMTKAELLAKASDLGLEATDKQTKAEIIEMILAAQHEE